MQNWDDPTSQINFRAIPFSLKKSNIFVKNYCSANTPPPRGAMEANIYGCHPFCNPETEEPHLFDLFVPQLEAVSVCGEETGLGLDTVYVLYFWQWFS